MVTAVEPEAAAVRRGLTTHAPRPGSDPLNTVPAAPTTPATTTEATDQVALDPPGAAGQVTPDPTGATGAAAPDSTGATGAAAPDSMEATRAAAPGSMKATGAKASDPTGGAGATAPDPAGGAGGAGVAVADVVVATIGVGSAEAAAATARLLAFAEAAGRPYAAVISAGIGGGLPGRAVIGDTVVATRSIAADLGADSPDGYLPIEELGFGNSVTDADTALVALLREVLPTALTGDVLTVNTVTGTADRAADLTSRHPSARAEAMEGYGVAVAARAAGVPFAELRTISNPVGPRDRASWNLPAAFTALTAAFTALSAASAADPGR